MGTFDLDLFQKVKLKRRLDKSSRDLQWLRENWSKKIGIVKMARRKERRITNISFALWLDTWATKHLCLLFAWCSNIWTVSPRTSIFHQGWVVFFFPGESQSMARHQRFLFSFISILPKYPQLLLALVKSTWNNICHYRVSEYDLLWRSHQNYKHFFKKLCRF